MNMILANITSAYIYTNPFYYRSYYYPYTDASSLALVVVGLGILLHEMPRRNVSFGGAIITISAVQIIGSAVLVFLINVWGLIPLTGSGLTLLGGVKAVRWKPTSFAGEAA